MLQVLVQVMLVSTMMLLEDIFLDPDLFAGIEHMALGDNSLSRVVSERFYLAPSEAPSNSRWNP